MIDLDWVGWGPAGYDLITALLTPGLFPPAEGEYQYTRGQMDRYLAAIDALYAQRGLPAPSTHIDDYMICKLGWAARWRRRAELREWMDIRYGEMLAAYLREETVRNMP